MRIAVVADTHLPRGARRIPERCVAAMRDADLIVHAGDISAAHVLDWLEGLGPPLLAVQGNVDDSDVRRRLPESASADVQGARLTVVHDSGSPTERRRAPRRSFGLGDVVEGALEFQHVWLP